MYTPYSDITQYNILHITFDRLQLNIIHRLTTVILCCFETWYFIIYSRLFYYYIVHSNNKLNFININIGKIHMGKINIGNHIRFTTKAVMTQQPYHK